MIGNLVRAIGFFFLLEAVVFDELVFLAELAGIMSHIWILNIDKTIIWNYLSSVYCILEQTTQARLCFISTCL